MQYNIDTKKDKGDTKMKMYRKEIMVKDWDYDDYSNGRVVLNWTREEDYKGEGSFQYRFRYKEYERYIEIDENGNDINKG